MSKAEVTHRAQRYRANRAIHPEEPKGCAYCGNPKDAGDVEHIDGDEANNEDWNLCYSCRPCNVAKGRAFADAGIGVKTLQFNPSVSKGITDWRQYLDVVMVLRGQSDAMKLQRAISLMHNTPRSRRGDFQRKVWQVRKDRQEEIPF
jgi:hypothetical protein